MSTTSSNHADDHPDSSWESCPQGEISTLVNGLRARTFRRNCLQAGGGVAALGLAVFLAWQSVPTAGPAPAGIDLAQPTLPVPNPSSDQNQLAPEKTSPDRMFGGIACSNVHNLALQYVQGELDSATLSRIEKHLLECPDCRSWVEEQRRSAALWNTESVPDPRDARHVLSHNSQLALFQANR